MLDVQNEVSRSLESVQSISAQSRSGIREKLSLRIEIPTPIQCHATDESLREQGVEAPDVPGIAREDPVLQPAVDTAFATRPKTPMGENPMTQSVIRIMTSNVP